MIADINYFADLWRNRRAPSVGHSPELWNERAAEWIADLETNGDDAKGIARVRAISGFLRSKGLLNAEQSVIDIGCGPGTFTLDFAKTCKEATGLDYSKTFTDYGAAKAGKLGLGNAKFVTADFDTLDVSAAEGAFDLVFASITPAASTWEKMQKVMSLSRGYVCNVACAASSEDLPRYNGTGFYSLWNLLWLAGYLPETFYYTEYKGEKSYTYGVILWSVRKKQKSTLL
ncbi:MAG: class I SAM-dependent methyltransferase [Oscillospiraceae bacterium]|jgi:SAM-dependent methyltransferase|nr:class I SAM-dependent methyltransferase [Oscillospiraceae bacterium]